MSMVIAVREDSQSGAFFGFEEDRHLIECRECRNTAYTLRYTKDQQGRLSDLRFRTLQLVHSEHPKHSDQLRIA